MRVSSILLLFLAVVNSSWGQEQKIKVIDTDFSKGRLTNEQTIWLGDIAKFHGHLCDGLVLGFTALAQALYQLYPNEPIDRTNTRIVSKSSPCLTDVAIYLTGGRYQFNTFFVADTIRYLFIVQRIDNKKAFGVSLKNGVKPAQIDSLGSLAVKGQLHPCDIDKLRTLEDEFSEKIIKAKPVDMFIIEPADNFVWAPVLTNNYIKTDILNKNLRRCE